MANQQAIQDDNQSYALIAHSGTAGTAETVRVVADSAGNLGVNIVSGEIIASLGTVDVLKAGSVVVTAGTIAALTNGSSYFKLSDENGTAYGVKHVSNKPRVSSMPYLYDIAEGNVSGHTAWSKVGYNSAITTSEEDIWSAGGTYVFPTAADGWDVVSSSTKDAGTEIHSGSDATITATTITKAGENFLTTTAVGDCVILDKSGTTPAWGYVTAVTSDTVLTIGGGWSTTPASTAAYSVIDQSVATNTGAQAVKISYLDGNYAEKTEIVILNGTTPVNTVNVDMYRCNSFRVIAAGSTYKAVGNLSLRLEGGAATVYSYISAGYTRARNTIYTVPAGKTLYITQWSVGASTPNDTKVQTCRVMTRANVEPSTGFKTDNIFYGYTEFLVSNGIENIEFTVPTKLNAKTDIKVSAVGLTGFSGPVTSVLRGWIE